MGAELGRWLIALGAVGAWTGFTILGVGMSELTPAGYPYFAGLTVAEIGGYLTVIGLVMFVVGIFVYRATVEPDTSAS
ncbi:MAG: hypothetical protein IT337_16085 [Thermomicrobiales bacterium]|nr:hypothetical protein [Thermomicrobiales bacterium]